jgi:hypothetical protein
MSKTILESDIELYTGGIENAQRRLCSCLPEDEAYWFAVRDAYTKVVEALKHVDAVTAQYKNRGFHNSFNDYMVWNDKQTLKNEKTMSWGDWWDSIGRQEQTA